MIGIFDSGLGGLSALKEVHALLPSEDIIYFGDTGRVPYGTRSKETIIKYCLQDLNFLKSKGVDAVMVACGTASSNALDAMRECAPGIPIVGVIDAGAKTALASTKNKKIGIAGTPSTIKSGAFERTLLALDKTLSLTCAPCPLFVPLVENGFVAADEEITQLAAKTHLKSIIESGADTLILGCTHYPIISGAISAVMPGVKLINVGAEAARELAKPVAARDAGKSGTGRVEYYVSDEPQGFERIASIFLGEELRGTVTRIDIEKY